MTRERVGCALVGLAVGALLDSFVLHQLLQWHHVWSRRSTATTLSGIERNVFADGVLNVASLATLLLGLGLMLGRPIEARPFVALGLIGWGLFQIFDEGVFHLAFGAHHIREGVEDPALYDWAFVALGFVFMTIGFVARRRTSRATPT